MSDTLSSVNEEIERSSSVSESNSLQVVGFNLSDEEYGIEITKIREIILPSDITRIPQVPEYIEGLINLRGSVIPIIDMRKRLNLFAKEQNDNTRIIVITVGAKTIGAIVDAVTQVIPINHDQIDPAPPTISTAGKEYVSGLAKLEGRLLILLDIEKLLSEDMVEALDVNTN